MSRESSQLATFAGGCFWCMQPPFDNTKGVVRTTVGYLGGSKKTADYKSVCTGETAHYEAIEVEYDPQEVSYTSLLQTFWHNIDPTQVDGQFADRGPQYRTAIFYHTPEQKEAALDSISALNESGKFDTPIATEVVAATEFYSAEEEHQGYYKRNSEHYNAYKVGSGRAGFIADTWKENT